MEYPEEPKCETESAEFCSTTITKSETLIGTSTSTVTKTDAGCNTVYGCHLTDVDTTKTVSSGTCEPTDNPNTYDVQKPGCPAPAIVYPQDPGNVGNIPQILAAYKDAVPVKLKSEDWTAFYWIPYLGVDTMAKLRASVSITYSWFMLLVMVMTVDVLTISTRLTYASHITTRSSTTMSVHRWMKKNMMRNG